MRTPAPECSPPTVGLGTILRTQLRVAVDTTRTVLSTVALENKWNAPEKQGPRHAHSDKADLGLCTGPLETGIIRETEPFSTFRASGLANHASGILGPLKAFYWFLFSPS